MRKVLPSAIGFRLVPGNYAPMKGADLHGRALEDGCGHAMDIWLKLVDDRVAGATFVTDGCESFVLCGSLVAHLVQGRTLGEAGALDMEEVLAALGDREQPARHSAELALRALRAALTSPRLDPLPAPGPRP